MVDKMKTLKGTKEYTDSPSMERSFPTIRLSQEDLPAIKNWRVGGKYKLEIEVEMTGLNKEEYLPDEPLYGSFKIKKLKDMNLTESEKKGRKGY